jgi:hypothetical protein
MYVTFFIIMIIYDNNDSNNKLRTLTCCTICSDYSTLSEDGVTISHTDTITPFVVLQNYVFLITSVRK